MLWKVLTALQPEQCLGLISLQEVREKSENLVTRESHQLSQQFACGATETSEKSWSAREAERLGTLVYQQ